jgi:hypothetical protein
MFVENRSRGRRRNSFVVAEAGGLCGMTEGADDLDVRAGGSVGNMDVAVGDVSSC